MTATLPPNSLHDLEGKHGVEFGKVIVMRRGQVLRDAKGRVTPISPEGLQRGDVICDHQLRPLRNRYMKGTKPNG